jgi:hypothetical protein
MLAVSSLFCFKLEERLPLLMLPPSDGVTGQKKIRDDLNTPMKIWIWRHVRLLSSVSFQFLSSLVRAYTMIHSEF